MKQIATEPGSLSAASLTNSVVAARLDEAFKDKPEKEHGSAIIFVCICQYLLAECESDYTNNTYTL